MVRAGLGYLAAADATQLAAATQAECLRELEQADAVATAARAAMLAAFTAGQGYAGDAEYGAVSWLMHRTGITRGAAVGHAAWAGRTRTHPKVVAALAAGQVSESVGRLICLWTAGCRRSSGTSPTSCCWRPRRAGWGWRSWRRWSRRCTSGPAATCRMRTRTPGLRGPRPEAGDHVRRRRRDARGPDAGMRRGGRAGAGRAGRPGRERRRPDEGPAVPRRAGRGDAPAGRQRTCCRSGPGSRSRPGCISRWPTCCCSTATPRCRSSGPRRSGPGGPRGGRSRPRPAANGGAWLDGDAAEAVACDAAMAPDRDRGRERGRAGDIRCDLVVKMRR